MVTFSCDLRATLCASCNLQVTSTLDKMDTSTRKRRWIVALIVFELVVLAFFAQQAPKIDDLYSQSDEMRRQTSPNIRRCLPKTGRDPRFASLYRGCLTNKQRQQALHDAINEASMVMESLEVDYWLDSGVLLGQYRMSDVLLWDGDAELAILTQGFDTLRTADSIRIPLGYELNVWQSDHHSAHDRDESIPARLVETTFGFYVDIFVFDLSPSPPQYNNSTQRLLGPKPSSSWSNCVKCPVVKSASDSRRVKRFIVPEEWILPTAQCTLSGFQVRCPANPVAYLEHLYGDDFRVPSVWE